jgi:hypothetical protein
MVGAASNSVLVLREALGVRGANPDTTDTNKSKRKEFNLFIIVLLRFEVYDIFAAKKRPMLEMIHSFY